MSRLKKRDIKTSLKVIGESNFVETVCADLPLVGMGLITEIIKETINCEKIYLFDSYVYAEPNESNRFCYL